MKKTFLSQEYRPKPNGAELDEHYISLAVMSAGDALFIEDQPSLINSVCIGPKNDVVLQTIEKNLIETTHIKILYLEALYQDWSIFCRNGEIYFLIKDARLTNRVFQPKLIYFRAGFCDIESKYAENLYHLMNILELWQHAILCAPMEHLFNNSKLLQATHTLIPAAKTTHGLVNIPKSYIVKGSKYFEQIPKSHVIVKSLSGIRSDVVDHHIFNQWDSEAVNYLPTLFQEKIKGVDIRIHSINQKLYAKKILSKKSSQSLRYKTQTDELQDYSLSPKLEKFCEEVIKREKLNLSGIDLMKTESGSYTCFEINPGPGWSAFHAEEPMHHTFLSHIMECLINGKI